MRTFKQFWRQLGLVLGLLGLPFFNPAAYADIYSFTDDSGTVRFTNVPDDKRFAVVLKDAVNSAIETAKPSATQPQHALKGLNKNRFNALIVEIANKYKVDQALIHAVIAAESAYNPNAVSNKGAKGLMQLMPQTAKRYGIIDLFDPAQNIAAGANYLKDLLALFNNNMQLAIAAYNAGENAVVRHGNTIPPYKETRQYVPRVLNFYQTFSASGNLDLSKPLNAKSTMVKANQDSVRPADKT